MRPLASIGTLLLAVGGAIGAVGVVIDQLGGSLDVLDCGIATLTAGLLALVLSLALGAPQMPSANPFDRENVDRQDEPRLRRPRDLSGRPVRR